LPIPVIGMTEAALHTACLLGRRFGLISFGTRSRWLYLDLVRRSGLLERMVAFETIELTTTENYLREGAQDQIVCEASERLVSAGAEAVVVTGAAVAGIVHRLTPLVPAPIVDGIGCAVGQAEYLVRWGSVT
jgi:allantoin racemase